jgi:hypothetical protein
MCYQDRESKLNKNKEKGNLEKMKSALPFNNRHKGQIHFMLCNLQNMYCSEEP